MVRTLSVRHFIHVFSSDIMSFPNIFRGVIIYDLMRLKGGKACRVLYEQKARLDEGYGTEGEENEPAMDGSDTVCSSLYPRIQQRYNVLS